MPTRSMTQRQFSRSKLELFLECPRCFHDDVASGCGRPGGPPFTLNLAVDALFKAEFDGYRARGKPHPLFATVGLDAVPFQHDSLETWRANFKGVRWKDGQTGWTFFGAVDDLWETPAGTLIVADYKATAKQEAITAANIHPAYRRQLEIYQFLVEQSGFQVEPRSWLVYANGIKDGAAFNDRLHFRTSMIPVDGDRSWVEAAFRKAVALLEGGVRPEAAEDCEWCEYVTRRQECE